MSARAVAAVRDWDARLGEDAIWVACSHGDVIKAILADALGLHLDQFQRIVVDPCSVSVVRYTATRPVRAAVNDIGGDLAAFVAAEAATPPGAPAPTPPSAAAPAAGRSEPSAAATRLDSIMRVSSSSSTARAGSSPAPSARPANAPSTCRPPTAPGWCRSRWRSSRSSVLADRLEQLLDEVVARTGTALPATDVRHRRAGAARRRGVPRRRDGAGLGRRRRTGRHRGAGAGRGAEIAEETLLEDVEEGPDALRVLIEPRRARAFIERARRVVAAGRPPCPLCGLPLDPAGHVCPRQNGYHRSGTLSS